MSSIYFRPQVTRFVILFVERSGSTYIATMLDSHPDIKARREEFAHLRQRGVDGVGQLAWAREFYSIPLMSQYKSVGFKTKLMDILDPKGFTELLRQRNCRVIQLKRRNIVKAAISTLNAKRLHEVSGNWNLLTEADRVPAFSADPVEFDSLLQERINWDRDIETFTNQLNLPTLRLYYEDLLLNEASFVHQIFNFIDVRDAPVAGKTLKNTKDDLREALFNFDELRNRYAGTIYETMFDEVLV